MTVEAESPPVLNSLARRLVNANVIEQEYAAAAIDKASENRKTFISQLIEDKKTDLYQLARASSAEFGIPIFDAATINVTQAPLRKISEILIEKHKVLPLFQRGNHLFVGLADPTNQNALDEIAFNTGLHIEPVIIPHNILVRTIDRAIDVSDPGFSEFEDDDELDDLAFEGTDKKEEDDDIEETPVVRFVNKILVDAIRKGASDIHLEPYEHIYRVRYRLDGVLTKVASPPQAIAPRISSRIKVMSGMDIAEKRVPQDGRIKLKISERRSMDFRVNTCPTLFGEKIVLRLLDPSATKLGVDQLGFEPEQRDRFLIAVNRPYGMVLVTGPTGSGKTVTLYTALNILNKVGTNISTVEDPVEIRVEGINQVQQNEKQGMTFARALRAFLRQDPDVIMVGEIRDLETAEIAVKAAQTGHLVLSTLHTNDTSQTVTRMMNMGIPSYNITSSVNVILAQRLVRRLHKCRKHSDLPNEALLAAGYEESELEELKIFEPKGCDECNEGYKGRAGIFEIMPMSDDLARIILEEGSAMKIAKQAKLEGMTDLRRAALNKVKAGVTDLIEINRVTKD